MFDRWLGRPARERGFTRWGFKEVRLGAAEAMLLHWIYPKAKFVLLSRNPYDCYRSLSDSGWHHVYYTRPDIRVDSAAGLARHWNRIVISWSELPAISRRFASNMKTWSVVESTSGS
jgi:Sulfotransferase family